MLKRGWFIVNLFLLTPVSTIALADTNSNQNAWLQAVQLQEQKNPTTETKTSLTALSQHAISVKQANNPQNAQTTLKPNDRAIAQVTASRSTDKTASRAKAVRINANQAQEKPEAHLWNLENVDILKVIAEVSRETGKNFIIDPQVNGKITIISTKPLSSQEVYQVFLSALQVLGYSAIPVGNAIKIMTLRDGSRDINTLENSSTPSGDNLVVQVMTLHYISAVQLVPILNPLIPTWASVSAVNTSNNLIVSGSAAVVNRIANIVKRVDTPAANGVDVILLQYATAEDVSTELNKLIQSARAYGDSVNAAVSADDRSNSIMLSGNQADRLRLKVLISQLDQTGSSGGGDTQVIHLHYIQVQDILPILHGIARQNVGSSGLTSSAQPLASASSMGGSNGSGSGSNSLSGIDSSFTNQVQTITNSELNSGAITGDGSKQQIVITGDVTNNALIITAPTAMMRQLQNVVSRLDIRPQQVLVQGIIAEVDATKAQNLGIEWGSKASDESGTLGPTTAFDATGGMGVGFIKNGDLRAVIQLLNSDSSTNILSTPSITVLNNGHADIEVGKSFSETTGEYQPSGTQPSTPFTQYQEKDVGLTLQVTPQITGDDSIRLAIDQTNSSIVTDSSNEVASSPNPTTNEEKISTSVLVNNGQVLVLGGLINAQKEKVTTQVPILGDIPLLGLLFKHTNDSNVKKDLLVFLRPVVISNAGDADQISQTNYNFIREREILGMHGMGQFTASATLMSPTEIQLPVPFTTPGN